ncbi:MAG: AAA family ATPase [Nitrososphaerales archaeon]|nr:AAA family ATPase [Nitrososphaerales archaeon]
MWVEKYRPKSVEDMVGNEDSRIGFLNWLKEWRMGSKPALLIGAPGTGKTTLVHLTANRLGLNIIELNASDVRTKERMERKLGPMLDSQGLFNERPLIFLDEVDGMYDRQDRGGVEFVEELMERSPAPIVMAANVEDDKKITKLIRKSRVFRFRRLPPRFMEIYIEDIIKKEKVRFGKEAIRILVKEAKGDMRAAINSAQSLAGLSAEELRSVISSRDQSYSLREGLESFFNAKSKEKAYEALRSCDATPRDKVRLAYTSIINGNLSNDELIEALEGLGDADEIIRRIERTQEWRILRYFDRVLAYSLFKALPKGRVSYNEDDMPWDLKLRMWNESRALRDASKSLSKFLHASSREIMSVFMSYLLFILSKDKESMERFVTLLGLEGSVLKVLMKEADRVVSRV